MRDLIDRQSAIDAIEQMQIPIMRSEFEEEQYVFTGMSEALRAIKDLPSAEPEKRIVTIKLSEEQIHEMVEKAKSEIVQELPSAQPEIIKCKDCEWWEKQNDSLQGRCALMQMYPTGQWYCGNAQRRVSSEEVDIS